MSDPRPYPPTDWEEEESRSAADAVDRADSAADDASAAAVHAKATMEDLIETSKEIAATSRAVEKITRDSVIADNKRFRRRNAVLVFLTCILIVGMGYMIHRDVWVNGPERDKIAEQTAGLQDANEKLDEINAFIDRIEADSNNDGTDEEELQAVFDAVFETREMVECVLTATDEASARECAG